jgi:hypothetical protein
MKDTEGFSILINGVERTFRDLRDTAIEIVDWSTGQRTAVGDDGRMN